MDSMRVVVGEQRVDAGIRQVAFPFCGDALSGGVESLTPDSAHH